MTDSNFQSTAGQSFRTPINTFVAPVDVVQKSSLMDFAETLAEVNPTLQNFIAVKAKERAEFFYNKFGPEGLDVLKTGGKYD